MLKKTKFPFWYILILGFIHIAEGLIQVLSLGNLTSNNWSLKYVMNYHRKNIKSKSCNLK